MTDYTIENQWKLFCKNAGLPDALMMPDQRREMRRAFFGAWGQKIISDRDEVSLLREDLAVAVFEAQLKEVADFWLGEQQRQN